MWSHTARNWRVWLAALALIAALGIAMLRVTTLSNMSGVRLGASWALVDFRGVIYYPVRAFIDGANPYDRTAFRARYPVGMTFPPFLPSTLLIHLPFGVMPLALASMAYVAFSVGLTVLLGWAAVRASGVTSWTAALLAAALVTLSRPGQWNLLLGQVTLQVVLLCWVALHFAQRTPWLSGLALGVAAFKPTFALPIGVLMLARGNVKVVGIALVSALALNLPAAAILEHRAGALTLLLHNPARPYTSWAGRSQFSRHARLYHLDVYALFGRITGQLSHAAEAVIMILVLAVAALLIRRLRGSETTPGHQNLSEAIIFVATLLCVHHLDYDLLLLAFPVAALVYRRTPGLLENAAVRRGMLCLFALMAANYVSTQSVLDRFAPGASVWRFALASANTLALILIFAVYGLTVLRLPSARVVPALDDPLRADKPWGSAQSESARARDGG